MIKISIIIPAYNEENTIIELLERVKKIEIQGIKKEVIVIDDCSKDNTLSLLKENKNLYDFLIKLPKNSGKGNAVKEGLIRAGGDYILFQDADLEYDPKDYVKLLEPVLRLNADLVIGSRLVASQLTRVYYFWHKVGNKFITFLFNIINNTTFTDIYSCYVVFRANLINPQKLSTNGWEQQAEILSKVVAKSKSFYEVPVNYYGRFLNALRCRELYRITVGSYELLADGQVDITLTLGAQGGEESNIAKLLAADASWEAGDIAMQTFGGFSFSEEYNIERKFRETRLYRIAPISTNMILAYLSHKVLGLPRSY